MIEEYYRILELGKNASLADIKKAYRSKAKLLHPDINKSSDAHEKFIFLNEAYEYLTHLKSGNVYNYKKARFTKSSTKYKTYEDWQTKERGKAGTRAAYNARMKYDKFTKTEYYESTLAFGIFVDHFILTVSYLCISASIIGLVLGGIKGFFIGLLITFLTVNSWKQIYTDNLTFSLKTLIPSLLLLSKTKTFAFLMFGSINIYLFFEFVFNTIVNTYFILTIFVIFIVGGYYIHKKIKTRDCYKPHFAAGIAPGLINLFFVINFYFTSNPISEIHYFTHYLERSKKGWSKTTLIILKDNKYSESLGIRVFLDYETISRSSAIKYEFEEGVFGFRVMKSYKLN